MRSLISPLVLIAALALPAAACGAADAKPAPASAQAPLSDVEIAAIQQLCETASFKYALALDAKDPDALAQAFSADGVWEVLGNRMAGRDAIRTYWKTRTADWAPDHGRLHSIANQAIDVIDRDHARGISKVAIYFFSTTDGNNTSLAPTLIAQNNDEYVRTAEGWKLSRRSIVRIANVGAK
ncbi:MAG: nuclear transport factor 2 family protein [Candidatus Andeanibacterium colombiense]|uniref:Nuclear transport factor 2 family protein n=1 Tax=Candidatus Andeanibacterium colombiense TaxID=3121345 RepID=A0AAJ5X6H5_9SPHN|nr:MAG: nuclear transport factor 2 family protein [Sphingomonadaceae bacterium]